MYAVIKFLWKSAITHVKFNRRVPKSSTFSTQSRPPCRLTTRSMLVRTFLGAPLGGIYSPLAFLSARFVWYINAFQGVLVLTPNGVSIHNICDVKGSSDINGFNRQLRYAPRVAEWRTPRTIRKKLKNRCVVFIVSIRLCSAGLTQPKSVIQRRSRIQLLIIPNTKNVRFAT